MQKLKKICVYLFCVLLLHAIPSSAGTDSKTADNSLDQIRAYISTGWDSLTRSLTDCATVVATKLSSASVLYLPPRFAVPALVQQLEKQCNVQAQKLPAVIHHIGEMDPGKIDPAGLLYLENRYVVPGGRFNEMYGWDSYFIIRGLVRDGRIDLAKGMVDNFFFEIEHYGGVLNANRTYYLTRSQPPFLTSMILAVYDAQKPSGHADNEWLAKAYDYAVKDYQQWNEKPHLAGDTGLSRYFDHGDGPVPEIMGDPSHYYRGVAYYFLAHDGAHDAYLVHRGDKTFSTAPGPRFP